MLSLNKNIFRSLRLFVPAIDFKFVGIFLVALFFIADGFQATNILRENLHRQIAYYQTVVTQGVKQGYNMTKIDKKAELNQLKQENLLLKQRLSKPANLAEYTILSYPYKLIATSDEKPIKIGSMVISQDTLLGLVGQTSVYAMRVNLLNELQSRPILVENNDGVKGLIKGDGQRILLTQVPHQQTLAVGQRIKTSGQLDIAPGLLIGLIDQLITQPTDGAQTAVIKPLVNFNEIQTVEIR